MGQRKSSPGNPYHDERGRFTTAGGAKSKQRDYAARSEARENGDYDSDSAKDLRALTKRAIESPNGGKQNEWEIRRGGYDKDYEAYHDGEPAFGVVDGEVEVYQDRYKAYAEEFSAASGYPIKRNNEDEAIERHAKSTGKTKEEARKDFNETVGYYLRGTGKTEADIAYARKEAAEDYMSRDYGDEVVFASGGNRCHAEIVDELPPKGKYSNGYADIGQYEQDGKLYTVYSDRDSDGAYSYYAVRDVEAETRKGIKTGSIPQYQDDKSTRRKHKALKEELGDNESEARARALEHFEVDGESFTSAEKKIDGNGNVYYMAKDSNGNARMINSEKYESRKTDYMAEARNVKTYAELGTVATRYKGKDEKEFREIQRAAKESFHKHNPYEVVGKGGLPSEFYPTKEAALEASKQKGENYRLAMPWETDAKYQGQRNAKLRWLRDHPESEYNNQSFVTGIKRIERMADSGSSAESRQKAFKDLCERMGFSEEEGLHFIDEDFLV